jgi:hypothetical protein
MRTRPFPHSSVSRERSTALRRSKAIAARLRTELATALSLAAEEKAARGRAETTADRLTAQVEMEKLRPTCRRLACLRSSTHWDGACSTQPNAGCKTRTYVSDWKPWRKRRAGTDNHVPSPKQIAPFLQTHIYKLETAPESSNNAVALVRRLRPRHLLAQCLL